jgi:hypothetical protein
MELLVAATICTLKPAKPVSEKTRAEDERLRQRLENLTDEDMKTFDRALKKAIKSGGPHEFPASSGRTISHRCTTRK